MKRTAKILAIDGEEIVLKSISKALRSDIDTEYSVVTASTALEGLKLVRSNMFDLILLDLTLPGMNGIEALRRIKNSYPLVSVIIMSGYSYERTFLNQAANNADGLLSKPFTIDEIKCLVAHILWGGERCT